MGWVVNCPGSLWSNVTTRWLLMEVSLVTVTASCVIASNTPKKYHP